MLRMTIAPSDRLARRHSSDSSPAFVRGRDRLPGRYRGRPSLEGLEPRIALSGTWTRLRNLAPEGIGEMMLLSDGTVMAQGGGGAFVSSNWYRLTPDASGATPKARGRRCHR
jgi:hypothetical protein